MVSRNASLSSLHGADQGCSPCSATIVSLCCNEEEDVAEKSMGSPPVMEDPVFEMLFGDVNLENKSDYDMIDRMIKGEKFFEPEALTALTPFDVEAISRDADRILEKVERGCTSADLTSSPAKTRRRGQSKHSRSSVDTPMTPSTPSAQRSLQGLDGNKGRGSPLSSRRDSVVSQKAGQGASKKRAGKTSAKGGDKDVGDGTKSGKTKVTKKGKDEGRRHQDEKERPAVEEKLVETVPPLEPPSLQPMQIYPSPVCSLCEQNVHEGNFGFAPCAAYGDYRVNYCTVQKTTGTPAAPGDGQGIAATSSVARE